MKRAISALFLASVVAAAADIDETGFSPGSIITRDVAVLGGGASGSYAAVKLREDLGHSVIVIEAKDHLGGHVDTYNDPITARPVDFGVHSYIDTGGARAFFERMGVATSAPARAVLTNIFADFRSGAAVPGYVRPNNTAAMERYLQLCQQYQPLLLPSYDKFPRPGRIPEDLLQPFGQFATKYGLEAAVPLMFQVAAMGIGDMMAVPTMYVMQTVGVPMLLALRPTTGLGFSPASRNNSELYGRIASLLGPDVLYSSRVVQAERRSFSGGVRLVVKRSDGSRILVKAKRLLVAFESTVQAQAGLGLDATETAVFSKWRHSRVYVAIVTHPSLPDAVSIINTPAEAAPSNYLEVPEPPYVVRFEHYGAPTRLYRVLMTGLGDFTADDAKALAQRSFDKLVASGVVPGGPTDQKLEFLAFSDHRAMHLHASRDELARGFIQKQYALQGHRSTWWTGASWTAQFTNAVWGFTDGILSRLSAEIRETGSP